ncbi:tRNA pseudouridine(55) synthase TruB [Rothia uropygialis]|uniref:tRNA pseudouridine(55) synthase TruB n=1 Tax=Kocuria sp. 36 TaxID=1415402 RepID=UPI00101C5003|nr:tRNA pseudouridine(55) synthase TruB [Kocuria sp. 36]
MARHRDRHDGGPSGLVVVDKPAGLTSHDVVARMRKITGTRRVGHAGTLDPMATGVLILGVNKATKLLTWVSGESKTYSATIRLGQGTVTDDSEGEVSITADPVKVASLEESAINAAVTELTGRILQVPSSVSAIKVDGVRSYARVRSGQDVELEARPVTIESFDVHDIRRVSTASEESGETSVIDVDVTVSCSAGTYIRALARDMGARLGVGGHLTRLERLNIGEVSIDDSSTLEELAQARDEGRTIPMLSVEHAAERIFVRRNLSNDEATSLSNGRWIAPSAQIEPGSPGASGKRANEIVPACELAAGFAPDGTLVALAQNQRRRGLDVAVPHLVFRSGTTFPVEAEKEAES